MCYNAVVMPDLKKEPAATLDSEKIRLPETNFEIPEKTAVEKEPLPSEEEKISGAEQILPKKPVRRPITVGRVPLADPITQKIEKIMEENVGDAYSRLSPLAKQEFKLKGEVTAQKISELLKSTHIKVKKIFKLILEWLKILPGVNRFFLEQEAKIKTDRIIELYKK